ncbi:aldehyde dehydrogenase family protein [Rubinisphaera sp.]|uniref:aldehyde dehydrogenase family protein n=1 Tax=Rubinisphaera sp. TaxID=2024857 RepID=UPI000C0D2FEA|nr:aldehyde dehydrogenase family protein [Rubinisphaera sp.]MBV08603.1 aldehyde dehydrogenase [Rubinisphaera sp.]HCS55053.1 aldehyde dehydrogenase [Planctomycetaceae bacterium]|tara:strand:- start:4376 stop:5809 length:1434 start_codon:yes stop_codon:yes gene_type:complete
MQNEYPLYVANQPEQINHDLEVRDKYSGEVVTKVAMADQETIERAISAAVEATKPMRRLKPYERQQILQHCVKRFEERSDELAMSLCIEAGKPIRDSRGEVTRLIDTFRIAAEEAVRIEGHVHNLEISSRAAGYRGFDQRVPIGPCSFISPFNFPLNLAAHKIAPAIAAGCPFVLKPASKTPIGALQIAEVLAETDLPEGAFSILPCHRDAADSMTTDERFKLLSFTGSPDVGWKLKQKAGKKKVILELGGNAACIVDEDADIEDAVERMIVGAFYQSGQSCIGVQRILIHEKIYEDFRAAMVEKTKSLKMGDPKNEETFIGPVITESDGERLKKWIDEALDAGGNLLCGGGREGAMVEATLLENVPKHLPICAEEAFGPVAVLSRFSDFDQALREVNESPFGLQAGLFTKSIDHMLRAWDELVVGGVIVGDIPSWRVDNMPYGGVKDSGLGREGIKYAIEDMTERRLLVIRSQGVS